MKKILLDTSFLIDAAKFRISLEEIGNLINEKYQLFVPSAAVAELERNPTRYAKIALRLLEDIPALQTSEKSVDKAVIALADKDTFVATNDRKLRARLKELGVRTIYLRAKKYLAIG